MATATLTGQSGHPNEPAYTFTTRGGQATVERRFSRRGPLSQRQGQTTATLKYRRNYPVLVNHERQTEFAASVAKEIAGDGRVDTELPPMMGAEDFSFMLNERPGAFIFIGNGDSAGLHHPAYNFNDDVIPFGTSYWVKLVETAQPA